MLLCLLLAPVRVQACQGHRWSMELDACVLSQEKMLKAVRAYEGPVADVRRARAFRVTLEYQSTLKRLGHLDSILLDPPDPLPGDRRAEYYKEPPARRCADHFVMVPFGKGIVCLVHPRDWSEAKHLARFACGSCDAFIDVSAWGWMSCRKKSAYECEMPGHFCEADCSFLFLTSHFEFKVAARVWRIASAVWNARLLIALVALVIVRVNASRRSRRSGSRGPAGPS